ncbi:MAG: PEPxxWA-CTERM sorting domain-containing protein [Bosea sp.]|uniref:PEPxxWA-CTERM sorting domain-containing protein n=1 Tax=Bosea sp. (in: a-proteobacteria) TaxID=1871050 RepID=UPI001AC37AEC|nr:PEPxxWA-CTERM sorting domain-containing protein [Bosea sp. (in: a-proteobacteria)]MBN9452109.1 PEPxxWA-CTERM sorting domain-containing protein [Bosea sp. (in: a-proteobacteria)]
MRRIKLLATVGALAAVMCMAESASAALVVGGYTLEAGSFGGQLGVHSNGTQSGNLVGGFVNQDGSAVTFSSTSTLSLNGSGEATVQGNPTMANLLVTFAKSWGAVTFDFETEKKTPSTMSLLVNGVDLFSGAMCGTLCDLGNGANKFVLTGPAIQTLAFSFDPAISDAKQFRLEVATGVPEPATWAMMLLGFAGLGYAGYRRRSAEPATA